MVKYRHTQIGYWGIVALLLGMFFIILRMAVYGFNWFSFTSIILLGICLMLFSSLTVVIDDTTLEIRFGPGIIRKKFQLKDIASCRVVKNPWYYGWGIRWIPGGWLYNISGLYAVEIKMKTGKKYRIGTDVPYELERNIRESIEKYFLTSADI